LFSEKDQTIPEQQANRNQAAGADLSNRLFASVFQGSVWNGLDSLKECFLFEFFQIPLQNDESKAIKEHCSVNILMREEKICKQTHIIHVNLFDFPGTVDELKQLRKSVVGQLIQINSQEVLGK
jgi:hypothetical protein